MLQQQADAGLAAASRRVHQRCDAFRPFPDALVCRFVEDRAGPVGNTAALRSVGGIRSHVQEHSQIAGRPSRRSHTHCIESQFIDGSQIGASVE